ncbi:lasso peptide biosynthesis B2 protein [Streptomyces sp. PSKA30]|uniref:lasso peptide biosynthesis B2 protein n=1 Tax=Streptomyces sp. PSKA30 TaxID=2874597 RepID=UPI001CD0B571|nr:lasso peptide biosynthesis B2 protein [Streptomyces sp. PSKA30]MBZ9644374.1 lasso peptide biosynthesis B2 protein [Streptomyces sp. PSKA30]
MTLPMTLEPRSPLPLHRRGAPLLAVGLSRLLIACCKPYRLEKVLRVLARGAAPASHAEALRARSDVVSVSGRCAGQYCLERSVAAALLARLRGRWPDWVSGVSLVPFAAHAWIEVDGRPVGESLRLDGFHKNIVVGCRGAAHQAEGGRA